MESLPFTLATYRVKAGEETREFVERWTELSQVFSKLTRPPFWGTLIQSKSNPRIFHSFGPWESLEDVAAMRSDAEAGAAFHAIRELCDELTADDYEVVLHVRVRSGGDA